MNKPDTWIEVTIPVNVYSAEAVENYLFEQGCLGVEEIEGAVKGYFPSTCSFERLKFPLERFLHNLRELGLSVGDSNFQHLETQDWSREWRKHFKPIRISPGIIVKPPWEKWPAKTGETVISIMPRMAFGTGTHETTQLCLCLLEAVLNPSLSVLGVGPVSGILAIAAARMGASRVLAVDPDTVAVENARENAAGNRVMNHLEIRLGSIEVIGTESFDLILANINRMVLVTILGRLKNILKSEGGIILSGILDTEQAILEEAIADSGLRIVRFARKGEWIGFFVRPY